MELFPGVGTGAAWEIRKWSCFLALGQDQFGKFEKCKGQGSIESCGRLNCTSQYNVHMSISIPLRNIIICFAIFHRSTISLVGKSNQAQKHTDMQIIPFRETS